MQPVPGDRAWWVGEEGKARIEVRKRSEEPTMGTSHQGAQRRGKWREWDVQRRSHRHNPLERKTGSGGKRRKDDSRGVQDERALRARQLLLRLDILLVRLQVSAVPVGLADNATILIPLEKRTSRNLPQSCQTRCKEAHALRRPFVLFLKSPFPFAPLVDDSLLQPPLAPLPPTAHVVPLLLLRCCD